MKSSGSHLHPLRRIQRIHFVGIAGAGMSGIAEVLVNQGFDVSGSDLAENQITSRLRELGATIYRGHDAAQVDGASVLVVSSAVPENNTEVLAARHLRIPVVPRAEMLAELMRFRRGIAVAGTHGKTTTTSLTTSLLAQAGMDPTFVIGGLLNAWGSNARLGKGEYLVAEADESDGSFLLLQPVVALVTNIDRDHLESHVAKMIPAVSRAVVTYGLSETADIRGSDVQQEGRMMRFNVHLPNESRVLGVKLNLPGVHNVRNALGAIAIAWELGVDLAPVIDVLAGFEGIGRRFAEVGWFEIDSGGVMVIEDYGHHPTELAATIAAARSGWPDRRIVTVFQPHRYSRTLALFDEFCQTLTESDMVVLTDIYPAGEEAIDGVDSSALCQSIRARGRVDPVLISNVFDLPRELPSMLEDGDLVLLLGAGNIGHVAQEIRENGFCVEAAA
jgi:UDP-N-acetylmuramate--alanine ligase